MDKEARELIEAAEQQGWAPAKGSDSAKLAAPCGCGYVEVVHFTNSDHRWIKNSVARMRRHGLVWPAPSKKVAKAMARKGTKPPCQQGG